MTTFALDLAGLMRTRRSVRRYAPRSVPHETLDRLFEAARHAPSAHNRQPWRYAVIAGDAEKLSVANAMGARLAADRAADGDAAEAIAADVARSRERLTQAPVLVLSAITMAEMDAYPDARRAAAERVMAIQGAAMSVQNLMLAAHAEGLGACWMCAPLFCPQTVRDALQLPADIEPMGLITLGFPAAPGRERVRKSRDAIMIARR